MKPWERNWAAAAPESPATAPEGGSPWERDWRAERPTAAPEGRQEGDPIDWGEVRENVVPSAMQLLKDMTAIVHSPVDTGEAMWNVIRGTASKLIPGEQESEVYADAVWQNMVERYGGVEALKNTLEQDPAGLVADLGGLLLGGGALAAKLGVKGATTAARVGAAMDPVGAAFTGARAATAGVLPLAERALGALPGATERRVMASAAKLPTTGPTGTRAGRDRVLDTMLDEGVTPSERGARKVAGRLEDVGNEIDRLISEAGDRGGRVHPARLTQELAKLEKRYRGPLLDGPRDVRTVSGMADRWLAQNLDAGREWLTVEDLQRFKTDVYEKINWDRAKGRGTPAVEEGRRAMGRDARMAIEEMIPEIADVNRAYGRLEELQPYLERSAAARGNRDLLGIGGPIKTTTGGVVAGAPGAAAGALAGVLDMPRPKAHLALALRRARNQQLPTRLKLALARQAALQGGRLEEEDDRATR